MKKEYAEILTDLSNNEGYYVLNIFIGELRLKRIIPDNALNEIDKQDSLPAKRLIVFDCLKKQEDSVLDDVEKIFESNKWSDGFQLIQQKRKEVDNLRNSNNEKPFLFAVKKQTSVFTGREKNIQQIHEIISQNIQKNYNHRDICSIVISGLGGIGKTQLVLAYIHKFKETFDSIVWINAESETALTTSFNNLALELNITLESLRFEAIAKEVSQKISTFGNKNLFVFDNADEINPHKILPLDFQDHFFLITNRHQRWSNDSKIINLEALTEEEAVQFVERSLEIQVEKKKSIRDFVLALECFPLALRQATSYIKMKYKLNSQIYAFKEYISEMETNAKNARKLLSFLPEDVQSTSTSEATMLDIITTWQITFNKIRSMQYDQHSHEEIKASEHVGINTTIESLPSRILNICAYLLSDNIPVNLFFIAAYQNEAQLSWAIDTLEKYSLITITQRGMMKIHKLVQQVTQLNLLDKKQNEKFIRNAVDLLVRNFPLNDQRLEAISVKQTLLPHLVQLKKHVTNLEQYQLNKKWFFDIICSLINCIIDIYYDIGEPKIMKKFSEELLSTQEEYYVSDCPEIASTLENLAIACGDLGESQRKKSLLERALQINECHYGHNHFNVAITLTNLANAFGDLGDFQTMKSLMERALKINEDHYGHDHLRVALTLGSLANAFGALDDFQTMKSLLERALKINEHHYGHDHFRVALTLESLANAIGALGDFQTMKSLMERALKINEHHYGLDHFRVALTLGNLANAFGAMGDFKTMKSLLERALQINERHYGPNHFRVAVTRENLANAFAALGDFQKNKPILKNKAVPPEECRYSSDHVLKATALAHLFNGRLEGGYSNGVNQLQQWWRSTTRRRRNSSRKRKDSVELLREKYKTTDRKSPPNKQESWKSVVDSYASRQLYPKNNNQQASPKQTFVSQSPLPAAPSLVGRNMTEATFNITNIGDHQPKLYDTDEMFSFLWNDSDNKTKENSKFSLNSVIKF